VKKRIWIITLFPEYFTPLMECGVAGQALRGERTEDNEFEIKLVDPRDFSTDKHRNVDDYPFGGGPGMVMRADVLQRTLLEGVVSVGEYQNIQEDLHVVYPSPRGHVWNNKIARTMASEILSFESKKDLVLICGRYEGVDERFLEKYVDEFYSVGDYVLTGGELAAMIILDSALRFVPGVLGNKFSHAEESFEDGLIEHPQYTRPREFEGVEPPEVLLSGHHKKIEEYQHQQKIEMTRKYRPDLWEKYENE
jgi:tRNA (guanine37-N1)-methyltransferase